MHAVVIMIQYPTNTLVIFILEDHRVQMMEETFEDNRLAIQNARYPSNQFHAGASPTQIHITSSATRNGIAPC